MHHSSLESLKLLALTAILIRLCSIFGVKLDLDFRIHAATVAAGILRFNPSLGSEC